MLMKFLRRRSLSKQIHGLVLPLLYFGSALASGCRQLCSVSVNNQFKLLPEKPTAATSDGDLDSLKDKIYSIANEILSLSDIKDVSTVLESRSALDLLTKSQKNVHFSVELMSRLWDRADFALEVFNWRRKQMNAGIPLLAEEYSKSIILAARSNNIKLCVALFHDARTHGIRSTCIYNALMSAYLYTGHNKKAISVFQNLKKDLTCKPTIVTYNIILSVYGRSMLIKHMESILEIINQSDDLNPNVNTYNTVIAGYVTAWNWDEMESTFQRMKSGPVKPNSCTHSLMLRGYAHSINIKKMERTYKILKETVKSVDLQLIQAMIWGYSKSSDLNKVSKIEGLLKLIPEKEYRPWLNVLLIRLYAQEKMIDSMDKFIIEALTRKTIVKTSGIMRSIIMGYYECDAVDRLSAFIKHAEHAGWRLCKSLYHCKMVMYGKSAQFENMHAAFDEMVASKLHPTKKTFMIIFMAYWKSGRSREAESIFGRMWKYGFCPILRLLIWIQESVLFKCRLVICDQALCFYLIAWRPYGRLQLEGVKVCSFTTRKVIIDSTELHRLKSNC